MMITLSQLKKYTAIPMWYRIDSITRYKGEFIFKVSVRDYPETDDYMGYRELADFIGNQ